MNLIANLLDYFEEYLSLVETPPISALFFDFGPSSASSNSPNLLKFCKCLFALLRMLLLHKLIVVGPSIPIRFVGMYCILQPFSGFIHFIVFPKNLSNSTIYRWMSPTLFYRHTCLFFAGVVRLQYYRYGPNITRFWTLL